MNQGEKNLESYLSCVCEWHVVWRQSATQRQETPACALRNGKVISERNWGRKATAEVNRTAERKDGRIHESKIHRRGSQDTS